MDNSNCTKHSCSCDNQNSHKSHEHNEHNKHNQKNHNHNEDISCSCCGHEHKSSKLQYILLAISLVSIILGYIKPYNIDFSYIAIVLCGYNIVKNAIISFFSKKRITTDLLITVALISAIVVGESFAAAEIAFIMVIGEMLEDYTVKKTTKGLKNLVSFAPTIAHLENGEDINAKDLKIGDVVIVKNGETIPIDGIVLNGNTQVDQSMITGESAYVEKTVLDDVFEGTINIDGYISVKATKTGKDSTLTKMIALVKQANSEKADSVKLMDKIASFIVPISIITAILVYIFTKDIIRAVTILVVFCPCALVLATPTAIMAGIGRATKMGAIIKSGQAIENLAKVNSIITDKTGTLTMGKMYVQTIIGDKSNVISSAASLECFSSHPIAKAILQYAKDNNIEYTAQDEYNNVSGMGLISNNIFVGNSALMNKMNVTVPFVQEINNLKDDCQTVLIVAKNNKAIGLIGVKDIVKTNAKETITKLNSLGINNVIMATGDNEKSANLIANLVGISNVKSDLLPEQKLKLVESLQSENNQVCMVGDGVNDAAAMAKSDCAIAMGAMGSSIAIDTADIALMNDDISLLPRLIKLARKTRTTIFINIVASVALSVGAVGLASFGAISPVVGALIHNLGAIVVVLNSLLLFSKKV